MVQVGYPRRVALDLVVRGGTVVTPQGVGPWDVGIQGERITVLALPGTLPTDGARVLDASACIVVPGGVDPHTHLAHPIRTRPDEPGLTLGPEDDTRGMACGGTTTHIDFCFVRPGVGIAETLEQRAARWAGRSHVDYSFHVTLCGALPLPVFAEMRAAIEAGFPSFKETVEVRDDEHPRDTTLEALARLRPAFRAGGTVTAGNASGVNDGACALLIASERGVAAHGLAPRARVVAETTAGVPPRLMGIGPVPATRKVLARAGLDLARIDVVELNEAFAAQALAVLRDLGLPDDAEHVNPNGGAIALGHPLGMSGARLATTATAELAARGGHYALCTMCIGVGQGIAVVLERV
jgi:acetyl-CoA acetyltransferase